MIQQMKELSTPCYVIDMEKFEENIQLFKNSFSKYMNGKQPILGYSVKTNHFPGLLKEAKEQGMMAEVVSDDEYRLAMECGYSAEQILFNGPQKSEELLIRALNEGSVVNLDNFGEIDIIQRNIHRLHLKEVKLGLRVNFDLEQACPGETTAGEEVSRFGFCVENGEFERALKELQGIGIPVTGLHMHYSSKSRSLNIFRNLTAMAIRLADKYFSKNEEIFLDIGGGFFLGSEMITNGKPTIDQYAQVIIEEIQKSRDLSGVGLILEPGAALLATPVTYLTKVINTRTIRETKVLTMDGSILHINPFMAGRIPDADCIRTEERSLLINEQILCGATCMENDRFLKLRGKPEMKEGDYLCCYHAGAYTMGFNSCFINLPPYVYRKQKGCYELLRDKEHMLMNRI